jgi:UDP-N-acetylmuramoylalanine--D-glutamate ligase
LRLAELAGRRVAILGAGREGLSAARLLCEELAHPDVTLLSEQEPTPDAARRLGVLPGLSLRVGADALADLSAFDVAIRSPGISFYRSELASAREQGLAMTSLTDLFLAENEGRRVIAVTGTKGKSTTASLIALALEACGIKTVTAGNIGTPVFDADPEAEAEVVVLEVSSYQACDLRHGPEIAVITSLHPEHLDWHGGLERYYDDKLNLLRRARGPVLVNGGNPDARARTSQIARRRLFNDPSGVHVLGDRVREGSREIGDLSTLPLGGAPGSSNLCAALAVASALDLPLTTAFGGFEKFRGLPHRQQTIASRDGIDYVDDSFSTIPHSTLHALRAFGDRPIAVIVGGRDRGVDLSPLVDALRAAKIRAVALVGETGPRLAALLPTDDARVNRCRSMDEAVAFCRRRLPKGGVVLLSPAAATGEDYADAPARGAAFARSAGVDREA